MSSLTRRYLRRSQVITAPLGAEMALLEMQTGSYLGFNDTATAIWKQLEKPSSVSEICEALMSEFDIGRERCRKNVERVLGILEKHRLVDSVV